MTFKHFLLFDLQTSETLILLANRTTLSCDQWCWASSSYVRDTHKNNVSLTDENNQIHKKKHKQVFYCINEAIAVCDRYGDIDNIDNTS